MLGALSSFVFNMALWNNAEDISKAFIKGGEYKPNLNMTGINPITKKIFGTSASEFFENKGLKATFKGLAGSGFISSVSSIALKGVFHWMFNPYVAPVKIALEGLHQAVKDENNLQMKNSLGIISDNSSLYMIDERSNILRNNILQGSNIQEQQVTQLLNTPNLSANIMNEILGKL